MRSVSISSIFVILVPFCLSGQISVKEIRVEGNQRFSSTAIVTASGLKKGSTASAADLQKAAQALFDTGLFTQANYKYAPAAGGNIVTLTVQEDRSPQQVVVDVPGLDEKQFWNDMAGTLVQPKIPASAEAVAWYSKQIQEYLRKSGVTAEIRESEEADLDTHTSLAVFQPAKRPSVAGIRFEGNAAIASKVLQDAISRLTIGSPYSEREFRRIVEANLRPLYEEKGMLTMAFRRISASGSGKDQVEVATEVEEGRVWNLGAVSAVGDGIDAAKLLQAGAFRSGTAANWKTFNAGTALMVKELQRDGYIAARVLPSKTFHDDTGLVDVNVTVTRGRQFLFGKIDLTGLSDKDKASALGLWKLQGGAPMNLPYVDEYLKAVFQQVKPPSKGVSTDLKTNNGSVDVIVNFK